MQCNLIGDVSDPISLPVIIWSGEGAKSAPIVHKKTSLAVQGASMWSKVKTGVLKGSWQSTVF